MRMLNTIDNVNTVSFVLLASGLHAMRVLLVAFPGVLIIVFNNIKQMYAYIYIEREIADVVST